MLRVMKLAHGRLAAVFHKTFVGRKGPHFSKLFSQSSVFSHLPLFRDWPQSHAQAPRSGTDTAAEEEDRSDLLLTDITRT